MKCTQCGTVNATDAAHCIRCGVPLGSGAAGIGSASAGKRQTTLEGGASNAGEPIQPPDFLKKGGPPKPFSGAAASPVDGGGRRKTMLDEDATPVGQAPGWNAPVGGGGSNRNRTMLDEGGSDPGSPVAAAKKPRTIGWMVSFDFNPSGQEYSLREGKTTIGRGRNNDCSLFYDGQASDDHAVVIYRAGVCKVKDNASTGGTHVNGEDIGIGEVAELKTGDTLKIGGSTFLVFLLDLQRVKEVWPDLNAK